MNEGNDALRIQQGFLSYKSLLELLSNLHRIAPHDRLRMLALEIEKRWKARSASGDSHPPPC
jgi:hypothetical protein